MCWLSPGASDIVGGVAIACAIIGSSLAGFHAVRRRARRTLAISAVVLNLSAPFVAYSSAAYLTRVAEAAWQERAARQPPK